jgi:multidrug efflux system membrane fusion protein
MRTKRFYVIGLLASMVACGGSNQARKGNPSTPVRVATAKLIDAPVNIQASGVVEPMQSVAVTAQVSGSLLDVAFKEGDVVRKGQVLFHIDPRPLRAVVDQARATLARDQAQAEAGRKDDERYAGLADKGYVSRSQADQTHATAVAQAATVAADRAALRAAEVNLGFTTIRSPIAGRTGSLLVRPGNNVAPGSTSLVVINQISPVLVRFPVLSQDFNPLQRAVAQHPVNVRATSSDSTPSNELGRLDFLDNAIDSLTGTVTGKARFENSDRNLWPGQLVFLTLQVSVERGVLAVPTDAVQTGQQGSFVYVVDAKSTARVRNVQTGLQVGDLTVIPKGLVVGERVVTDGQSRLNPGARVAIITTGGDTAAASLGSAGGQTAGGVAGGEVSTGGNAPGTGGSNGSATPTPAPNGRAGSASGGANGGGVSQPNFPPPIVGSPSGATTTPTTPTLPTTPPQPGRPPGTTGTVRP